MTRLPRAIPSLLVSSLLAATGLSAAPVHAARITVPVQC